MSRTKWVLGFGIAIGMIGMSGQVIASCPAGHSNVYILSGSTSLTVDYSTTCVATTDPDKSGKCATGKVSVSDYKCIKPIDGTDVRGTFGDCPAGEILQGVPKCAAAATNSSSCPKDAGTVGIATTSGDVCADSSNKFSISTCQLPTTPSAPLFNTDSNNNCPTGYMTLSLPICIDAGSGVEVASSVTKIFCTCPPGQIFHYIDKCTPLPLTCPTGQGSVLLFNTASGSASIAPKCVPVTNSNLGICPEGKILTVATIATSGAYGSDKEMCVTGAVANADGSCPANMQSNGKGQCVAMQESSQSNSKTENNSAKNAATPPASESNGGGSCSLIR